MVTILIRNDGGCHETMTLGLPDNCKPDKMKDMAYHDH